MSEEEAMNYQLKTLGLSVEELREHLEGYTIKYNPGEIYNVHEKGGFDTSTGKVEFYSTVFEEHGFDPLPRYVEPVESPYSKPDLFKDYLLVCGTGLKLRGYTRARFRTLPSLVKRNPYPFVEVNPETAGKLGIRKGEWVAVKPPMDQSRLKQG